MTHAGERIGNVVLVEMIGEGGMGTVWTADHTTLGRKVAVKLLSARCEPESMAKERFTLEARTIARLASPHVPQIFDHGTTPDGTPYMVMELVRGVHLRSWIAQHGRMSLRQATLLVTQVGLALSAAHELGIVHRDIKPENLILSGEPLDFHVTLIDFGIAKFAQRSNSGAAMTAAGTTLGTTSYMSPEQLMGTSQVDGGCDLWSLAVVAYWAFVGRLPFAGESSAAVYVAATLAQFEPVTTARPDLPAAVDAWFRTAFAPDVALRFKSAPSMTHALASILGDAHDGDSVGSKRRSTSWFDSTRSEALSVTGLAQPSESSSLSTRSRGRVLDAVAIAAVGAFVVGSGLFWSATVRQPAAQPVELVSSHGVSESQMVGSLLPREVLPRPASVEVSIPRTSAPKPVAITPPELVEPAMNDVHFTNRTAASDPVRASHRGEAADPERRAAPPPAQDRATPQEDASVFAAPAIGDGLATPSPPSTIGDSSIVR